MRKLEKTNAYTQDSNKQLSKQSHYYYWR